MPDFCLPNLTVDTALVRHYETLTVRTAPALNEAHIGPWLVRASANHITRANSACLLGDTAQQDDAVVHIADVEAWYAAQGQPTVFRLNPHLVPAPVFAAIAARGYQPGGAAWLMHCASLPDLPATDNAAPRVEFRVDDCALADGVARLCEWKGLDAAASARELARQSLFTGPQRMRAVRNANGEIVAVGMARCLAVGKYADVGIFAMHTAPEARRRGLAGALVREQLAWGRAQGATRAFLQVDDGNAAAISLYERLGFARLYRYQTFAKA